MQFLVGLSGNSIAVVASGLLLGLLPFGVWALFESESSTNLDLLLPGVAGVVGVLGGGMARWAASSFETMPADVGATLLCAGVGAAMFAMRARQGGEMCPLRCGSRLTERSPECLRCELVVCGNPGCWYTERYRCADCDLLRRPLFPSEDEDWWAERMERELGQATCERCNRHEGTCTLYNCGGCSWPTCTRCWDSENGRCVRCGWVLPGLPKSLSAHLAGRYARAGRTLTHTNLDGREARDATSRRRGL